MRVRGRGEPSDEVLEELDVRRKRIMFSVGN